MTDRDEQMPEPPGRPSAHWSQTMPQAERIPDPLEVCPWNPFPHDSEWGRRINEMYRRDKAMERARRRIMGKANAG